MNWETLLASLRSFDTSIVFEVTDPSLSRDVLFLVKLEFDLVKVGKGFVKLTSHV